MKTAEESAEQCMIDTIRSNQSKGQKYNSNEDIESAFILGAEFAQQWIEVEDELPEYGTACLLKFVDETYEVGYFFSHKYREDSFYSYCQNDIEFKVEAVTHWRPIERH